MEVKEDIRGINGSGKNTIKNKLLTKINGQADIKITKHVIALEVNNCALEKQLSQNLE